ncbi:unnamed protein product, partial [Meganyctiphanes norvegica]
DDNDNRPPENAPPENAPPENSPPENAPLENAPPENAPPENAPPENAPPENAPPEREQLVSHETECNFRTVITNEIENLRQEVQQEIGNLRVANESRLSALEDRGICRVCFTEPIDCLITPCYHWVICIQCYRQLPNVGSDQNPRWICPICGQDIESGWPFYGLR